MEVPAGADWGPFATDKLGVWWMQVVGALIWLVVVVYTTSPWYVGGGSVL